MTCSIAERRTADVMRDVSISRKISEDDGMQRLGEIEDTIQNSHKIMALTQAIGVLAGFLGVCAVPFGETTAARGYLQNISKMCEPLSNVAQNFPKAKLEKLQADMAQARTLLDNLMKESGQAQQVSHDMREQYNKARELWEQAEKAIAQALKG